MPAFSSRCSSPGTEPRTAGEAVARSLVIPAAKGALERNEGLIDEWTASVGRRLKKAQNEGRTIVSLNASCLSQRPHRRRTWAPRGQTPLLPFHFNWKTLSVIVGVTVWNFYFPIFEEVIKSEQIIECLKHLPAALHRGRYCADLGPASGSPR